MFLILPLWAESGDEWYIGKKISAIETTGLVNVKEKTVTAITGEYVGKEFSNELFDELYEKLYSQSWLDYMLVDAEKDSIDENGVVLSIDIYENPMISSVEIEGNDRIGKTTLLSSQSLSKGAGTLQIM